MFLFPLGVKTFLFLFNYPTNTVGSLPNSAVLQVNFFFHP